MMLFYNLCLLISNALVCLILTSLSQGAPVGPDGRLPPGFRKRGGLSPSDFSKASYYVKKIKQFTANKRGRSAGYLADSNIINDVAYGPDLAKSVYLSMKVNSQSQRRNKRKTIALDYYSNVKKWNTVYYKIHPDFNSTEQDTIRTAFQKWEDNTIIDTSEVTWNYNMGTTPHLIIADGGGCWSYLGQQLVEQMLSLQGSCFYTLGSTSHELGHALGLLHEQQRPDRNSYIDVDMTYVPSGWEDNWEIPTFQTRMYDKVPFDYSSVMMYSATSGSIPNGSVIIEPHNTEYEQGLSQMAWQSFYDEMAIDWSYALYPDGSGCDGHTISCNRGGYPDPRYQCTQCKCSDGFGGTTCTVAAAGVGNCLPSNSGDLTVSSTSWSCLNSPSYGTANYPYGTLCNWHLKTVDPADEIEGQFQGSDFGTLCWDNVRKEQCLHWVEVKYRDMHLRGPRFCCDNQNTAIITATGEMAVIFNAEYNYNVSPGFVASLKKGFKFCYRLKE